MHGSQVMTISRLSDQTLVSLSGRMDAEGAARFWGKISREIKTVKTNKLVLDLKELSYLDAAGAAVIQRTQLLAREQNINDFHINNLEEAFQPLMEIAESIQADPLDREPQKLSYIEQKGRVGLGLKDFAGVDVGDRALRQVNLQRLAGRRAVDGLGTFQDRQPDVDRVAVKDAGTALGHHAAYAGAFDRQRRVLAR